jgi:hypothetical protein
VFCAGSVLELLSASSVSAVCQDSKVLRFLWFPFSITLSKSITWSWVHACFAPFYPFLLCFACFVSHSLRVRIFSSRGIFLFRLCTVAPTTILTRCLIDHVLLLVVSVLQIGVGVRGFSLTYCKLWCHVFGVLSRMSRIFIDNSPKGLFSDNIIRLQAN